mgnify:CR=1 FL=1
MKIPVFVIVRDRLTCLQQTLGWLEVSQAVSDIVLLDNASTYPPMLEFLRRTKHRVVSFPDNQGPSCVWTSGILDEFEHEYFAVTDPDLVPREDCPHDLVEHCVKGLEDHPTFRACGPGLEIGDLPDHYAARREVIRLEAGHWSKALDPEWYVAPIDSTFAVYRYAQHMVSWHETRQRLVVEAVNSDQPPIMQLTYEQPTPGIYSPEWTRAPIRIQFKNDSPLTFAKQLRQFGDWIAARTGPMLRAGYPYVIRHLTWYIDSGSLPEEELYYLEHAREDYAGWTRLAKRP